MDSQRFEFDYPLPVLCDAGFVFYITGPKGKFLPVFTDADTAAQFIEDEPVEGLEPATVNSRKELLRMLRAAEKKGVEHVVSDPASVGKRKSLTAPVARFIAEIGRALAAYATTA